ncbi:imidazole glycerol phosphate synthase subunit HisH [uncultured Adlercreutzia sp.]|uniref:imidazole glycerol phosphate synthase subunit HisH n=1 Tax=uncultured Adlercreutzia sp. TaxID=875803 RepID=UPI0025ED6748|nr:imidazole glycerol phosphate synthase subunit HisH [uncultured Adlercreutzia sp.]
MKIALVDYHKGNLLSVERGLAGVGAEVIVTDDAAVAAAAEAIVLPGVGAFADAAAALDELGLRESILAAVEAGAPFLGICLGMHLMFAEGVEHAPVGGPNPRGLGLIAGCVEALPKTDGAGRAYKVPHVGWNSVEFGEPNALFDGIAPAEFFYFTHSFAAPASVATIAETTHSVTFPCAVQVPGRPVYGVQFHPEKSSDAGARLLANFVAIAQQARR